MSEQKDNLISDEMSEAIISATEQLVTEHSADGLSVRKILETLNITNRVFYNRFHNIDEVLSIVYDRTILKIRESLPKEIDESKDFFEFVTDAITTALLLSYDLKKKFNHYIFENDSISEQNRIWWVSAIKKLITYAKSKHLVKDIDEDTVSYALWCFFRGYNADAVARELPKDEAVKKLKYTLGFFLEGLIQN